MSSLLIKNARYLGDSVDLLVVDGKVQSLSASINAPADAEIVDAAGKILFPSLIDVHTHLREPGYEWKETVATGLSSAAHGGFGAILCMANTDPVNDDAAVTEQILESARRSWPNGPRVHPIGAATVGLKGEELTRMSELKDAGCVAISNDGRPVGNTEIFRRMLEYAADLDLIVIDHCEDPYLAAKSHMNEGATSGVLGVKGQPDVAETIQASRSILLADYLGVPVHIAHVSAKRTVDIIAWGKSRGVKVTAETTPHYLTLDDTAVNGYNTLAKVNPPLRTPADVAAMREAVKTGVIDMLAVLIGIALVQRRHRDGYPPGVAVGVPVGIDIQPGVQAGQHRDGQGHRQSKEMRKQRTGVRLDDAPDVPHTFLPLPKTDSAPGRGVLTVYRLLYYTLSKFPPFFCIFQDLFISSGRSRTISSGSGAVTVRRRRVTGWVSSSRWECRAGRGIRVRSSVP